MLPKLDDNVNQDLKPLRQYLQELSTNRNRLYEAGLVAVQNDFLPVRDALELTADDWSITSRAYGSFRQRPNGDEFRRTLKAICGNTESASVTTQWPPVCSIC